MIRMQGKMLPTPEDVLIARVPQLVPHIHSWDNISLTEVVCKAHFVKNRYLLYLAY